MKRLLVCTCMCLAAALLLASTAWAATRQFSGTVKGGGTVAFQTTFKHNKTNSMANLTFGSVPIQCDDGAAHTIGGPIHGTAKVHNRTASFSVSLSGGAVHAKTTAHFNKKGKKATGTSRAWGEVGGSFGHCDTGTVHWRASY